MLYRLKDKQGCKAAFVRDISIQPPASEGFHEDGRAGGA